MKFPRVPKAQKSRLVTGSRIFEGLLVYWGFLFESLIWIPMVRFGEVLNSLFPVESCGNSMCIALLKITRKGSRVESCWSDAALRAARSAAPRLLTCTVYLRQMDPVWLNAESQYCTLMKMNFRVQCTASLLCLHGIPQYRLFENCTALKKMPQVSQGILTSAVCSAKGDRPLLDLWFMQRYSRVPALLSSYNTALASYRW